MSFFLDNQQRTRITSDYYYQPEFDENGNGIINELQMSTFPKLPTKAEIKKYLGWEKGRYKPSIFTEAKYYGAIAHYSVWGWTGGFEIKYFVHQKDYERYLNRPFASEPTDRKLKRRTIIF